MKDSFNGLSLNDALQAAINVLRDSAECGRMPSGEVLPPALVELHHAAADLLEDSVRDSKAVAERLPPP